MSDISQLGKKGEAKVKEWLDKPEDGYCFDRIPDQMTGFYGSSNICDFDCYKYPNMYYIECKSTWEDRFDFSMISTNQRLGLLDKSKIEGTYGLIIILFATHKRAFIIDINEIQRKLNEGKKSINIRKINDWDIKYVEIPTIPNNRQKLLDYTGKLEDLVKQII